VLLTDGEDTAGRLDFDEVLEEARRSSILVYTVVLPPHDAPSAGPPWQMTQLAVDTGGETISARGADNLRSIYQRIAADVRNLYRVGYVPTPLVRDGTWHQVQVRPVAKDIVFRTDPLRGRRDLRPGAGEVQADCDQEQREPQRI